MESGFSRVGGDQSAVRITEVGPRDGLQNESTLVDTPTKVLLIERLVQCGHKRIEITAFVSPKWIPPLADSVEVARAVKRHPGVTFAALVPNMMGYERAVDAGIDEIALFMSASETHNKKNINATSREAWKRLKEVGIRACEDGVPFRFYISCIAGCPYEGEVDVRKVIRLSTKALDLGASEISLGDTLGIGYPQQIARIVKRLKKVIPLDKMALHLHDTYGRALENVMAGLGEGIKSFDSSVGGMGGCPYAAGAAGNLATEDLVSKMQELGIHTGLDLKKLIHTSKWMEGVLGRKLLEN